ncbi:3058_t:CDS:2 [Entrophospora sp. SA101]|nr:3058_t:CDS:2 [Entrophospora sp. SA101]
MENVLERKDFANELETKERTNEDMDENIKQQNKHLDETFDVSIVAFGATFVLSIYFYEDIIYVNPLIGLDWQDPSSDDLFLLSLGDLRELSSKDEEKMANCGGSLPQKHGKKTETLHVLMEGEITLVDVINKVLRLKDNMQTHYKNYEAVVKKIYKAALKTIDNLASIVPGEWNVSDDFERLLNNVSSYSVIVISMLYHEFERQMTLFKSCVDSNVALEEHVKDKMCPRTRLHQTLIDYHNSNKKISKKTNNGYRSGIVNWIHFQVGIFDEVILNNDLSNITTAFNSPNQFIFLNVTVKDDFVNVIVEAIVSSNVEPNRNYVVGDFVSHTFLGHIYKVVNQPEIKEFEVTNQLRLSGIVSARPLPRILYPDCNAYDYKLLVEISFQHHTIIYQKLTGHRRLTLKDWFINLYENKEFNYL